MEWNILRKRINSQNSLNELGTWFVELTHGIQAVFRLGVTPVSFQYLGS